MRTTALLLGAALALTLPLAGCQDDATDSSSTGGPSAGGVSASPHGGSNASGRDDCLLGTWRVDVQDMADQTAAKLPQPNVSGRGTGSITLAFGDTMTITYDNIMKITVPMDGGLTMVMTATFTGAATSTDWQAKDGKLAGTMPTNTVKNTMVTSINGKEAPATTTPFSGALDLADGQLGYTCSGGTATFTSPAVVWHLTKV